MPELPEVETIRRQLAPHVEGAVLDELEILDARWCAPAPPDTVAAHVAHRRIESLTRRGKYLVATLQGEAFLVMHLRMTGTLLFDPIARPAHTRVRLRLSRGDSSHELMFVDPRRFGTGVALRGRAALDEHLSTRVGLEPLGPAFTPQAVRSLARGCRAPIKAFLLDQRRIAGVGNIYADEALFRARIHPLRVAGSLRGRQLDALHAAVVEVLTAGIDARGASIDDFRHLDGARGSFQDRFRVHRRAGEPCPACGRAIIKLVAAGRGTYVCERCQPRPRRRRPAAPASVVRSQVVEPQAAASGPRGVEPQAAASGPRGVEPQAAASGPRGVEPQAAASGGDQVVQPSGALSAQQFLQAADRLVGHEDLREGHHPRPLDELRAAGGVLGQVDLLKDDAAAAQQGLGARAVRARLGRVDSDGFHASERIAATAPATRSCPGR